jgi:hypothetical protein
VAQQKDKSKRIKKQRKIKVPNPLNQLPCPMVTKDQNKKKVRRLIDIAIFVGKMAILILNVLKIWRA